MTTRWNRRDFVRVGLAAGGGLLVTVYGAGCKPASDATVVASGDPFVPNAYLRIDPDGSVIVLSKHLEMGQGSYTGLATIVADELDADWASVRVEGAPADVTKYANTLFGVQGTGGSTAIANSWDQYRKAGATARAVLLAAAAQKLGVPVKDLTTEPGVVIHAASDRRATYGELVGIAATLTVPELVDLKTPAAYRYIGKDGVAPRVDARPKSTGTATFTQDVQLPGMVTALVAHPPLFGAKVTSFDATAAKAVPGVVDVVQIPTGVAVLAENFWAARKGRQALKVTWDESAANRKGTAEVSAELRGLVKEAGTEVRKDGDADKALAEAAKTVSAVYEFPYLAHASMEPLNCVVRYSADAIEIWNGEQFQTPDQAGIAAMTGHKPEQISINMLYAGGSFGRRANPQADYVLEAVSIAKAIDGRVPVKMVWTREDDTAAGYFRPAFVHSLKGGLDASGNLVAWWQRIAGQSISEGTPFMPPDGKDPASFEGAADHPYTVANAYVDLHTPKIGIPVQWWRSVGHTHTAFAVEMFMDELAAAAGKDPLAFRQSLLGADSRRLAVLNLAAEKAGWGSSLPAGRARGVAVHKSFNSYVAQVAEVSLVGGRPKVHRVVCAVDCGIVVNPDIVRAQAEGAIAYGLSAALYGKIDVDKGKVVSTNFDRYRVLRMSDMPVVEVHMVQSTEAPTGMGEPGTPPIGPAVGNALFALTGKPVRKIPFV